MDTAPNYKPAGLTTNFRSTIQSPKTLNKGNWRTRQPESPFYYHSQTATKKEFYNTSGF